MERNERLGLPGQGIVQSNLSHVPFVAALHCKTKR
jgi:hypothetical protein